MRRKSQVIAFPALLASFFLLAGCPPPADFTKWERTSTTLDGVRSAMAACGNPVGGSLNRFPSNERALQFQCMQRLGFTRKDGFEFCDVMQNLPACVEQKIGHPLSVSQLEALPFEGDEGFYPIKPDSGRYENMQVSWRKVGASLHFSVQIANNQEALPVMYACGYPKPLGSNLAVASIGRTAKAQRCMIDHGFEPKDKMMLVCRPYPHVTGCKHNDSPAT
ncbi:hypothetical protein [Pseudomonas sp. P7548]|uniref:hypothetical protein n=1 Tax=Pseudomonas sp. P7548 TaxID=2726981 RepID=UPI0015B91C56|nr:hypothetical protein [Pseudomonas sp. P7548]NWE18166.1 hypothetical protein [Pseudomonas sp. P7548]